MVVYCFAFFAKKKKLDRDGLKKILELSSIQANYKPIISKGVICDIWVFKISCTKKVFDESLEKIYTLFYDDKVEIDSKLFSKNDCRVMRWVQHTFKWSYINVIIFILFQLGFGYYLSVKSASCSKEAKVIEIQYKIFNPILLIDKSAQNDI